MRDKPKVKICLICMQMVLLENFIEHFKKCRNQKFAEDKEKYLKKVVEDDGKTVYKLKKPCNCKKRKQP